MDCVHIYPLEDLREHDLEIHCWCIPRMDDGGIILHNSMDQREKYETGELKVN